MFVDPSEQKRADEIIGQTLRTVRKARKLTQAQVAERLHTTQTFVSETESGKRSIRTAEAVLYAYGIDTTPQKLYCLIESALIEDGLISVQKR